MPIINLEIGNLGSFFDTSIVSSVVDPDMINESLQPGDTIYYVSMPTMTQQGGSGGVAVTGGTVGGFDTPYATENCIEIGTIKKIIGSILVCNISANTPEPQPGDFIFFSKNRNVNESSIVGYYGKFRFTNNSRTKAELFSANCNVNISS